MNSLEVLVIAVVLVAIIGVILIWQARRLDALHRRVVNSLAVLDAQLVHRAQIAMRLAASDLLDEASKVIVSQAAWSAGIEGERLVGADPSKEAPTLGRLAEMTTARGIDRSRAESELSAALRTALGSDTDLDHIMSTGQGRELLEELRTVCHRVRLARRFHNDAVESVHKLRSRWLVRTARLAGRAALPHEFEMDDEVFSAGDLT